MRTRRSESDWRELVEAQEASGLNGAQFCKEHGLNTKYFYLRKKRTKENEAGGFAKIEPITASASGKLSDQASIKLRLIELELPYSELMDRGGFDQLLNRFLR